MRRVLGIVLIVMLLLSLVSCGNNDLIGKWRLEGTEELGMELIMEFTEDEMIFFGVGTPYEVKGNSIVVEMDGVKETIDFKVDGDQLTFSAEGEEQIFIRVEE